jgi:hypothetical protein
MSCVQHGEIHRRCRSDTHEVAPKKRAFFADENRVGAINLTAPIYPINFFIASQRRSVNKKCRKNGLCRLRRLGRSRPSALLAHKKDAARSPQAPSSSRRVMGSISPQRCRRIGSLIPITQQSNWRLWNPCRSCGCYALPRLFTGSRHGFHASVAANQQSRQAVSPQSDAFPAPPDSVGCAALPVKRNIQPASGMRQPAHADPVHARGGDLPDTCERHTAGRLEFNVSRYFIAPRRRSPH